MSPPFFHKGHRNYRPPVRRHPFPLTDGYNQTLFIGNLQVHIAPFKPRAHVLACWQAEEAGFKRTATVLRGALCRGTHVFPPRTNCPRCDGEDQLPRFLQPIC
jgi:hypothetical protein